MTGFVSAVAVLAALAAGCGDNAGLRDAAPADASATSCAVAFSGNFAETSRGASDCAEIAGGDGAPTDVTLGFAIPSTTLAAPLVVSLDLGATPAPGDYSPEIVYAWSALVTSAVDSACVYSAGTSAVPAGDFALALDAIDPHAQLAHGTLVVHTYVHAFVLTTCGTTPTEDVTVTF